MPDLRAPWASSTRRDRLPGNWNSLRSFILKRDMRICHVCHGAGADQVDHIIPGDNHYPDNLAAIHGEPCHREKTARERPKPVSIFRPRERHPGLR